jgi:hypothetical protein
MNKKYEFTHLNMLNKDELTRYVDIGQKKRIKVVIGG